MMELFNDIYNKIRRFSNNNGGRGPTNIRISHELLTQLKDSKHFSKFINVQEYCGSQKPRRICGLVEVIDDSVTEIQVY